MQAVVLPIFLFVACLIGLSIALLAVGNVLVPRRHRGSVKQMPYESGMDPIHDTRRRFDVRYHLLAIAFLVFDVELLFLYPWAVTARPSALAASALATSPSPQAAVEDAPVAQRAAALDETVALLQRSPAGRSLLEHRGMVFPGVMVFFGMLTLGFLYDWRKGIFRWR